MKPPGIADRTALLILQPTPFCNIDCRYCYLPDRADRRKMTAQQTLDMFTRLIAFPTVREEATLIWHAGEPLVMGVDYYETVFAGMAALAPEGLTVRHCIQTNGTLIDDRWCELFKRWDVNVGVSLDGPREMHDFARVDRAGRGTFDRTMAGVAALRRNGVEFHIISVLSERTLANPRDLFDFYRAHDLVNVAFNIQEREGANDQVCFDDAIGKDAVRNFLRAFVDLQRENDFPIEVRELEHTAMGIRAAGADSANEQVEAFGIVTVDVTGEVYTYSPELAGMTGPGYETFSVGNLLRDDFATLCASPNLARMGAEIAEGVAACKASCAYFGVCGGGAPSNKLYENGAFASAETVYCRLSKQAVVDFVLDTIEAASLAEAAA